MRYIFLYGPDDFFTFCVSSFLSTNGINVSVINELNRSAIQLLKEEPADMFIFLIHTDYSILSLIKEMNENSIKYSKIPLFIIGNSALGFFLEYILQYANVYFVSDDVSLLEFKAILGRALKSKVLNKSHLNGLWILTKREEIILVNLLEGKRISEISRVMGVKSKTVYSHKYSIMKKLNFKNAFQLYKFIMSATYR